MIIKNNSTRLIITLSVLLIFPFVQKQWFNLYLFNINNFSFYSILYYISGTICPFLISLTSLNNYTNYKFNNTKNYSKNIIKGRSLLFFVAINLIFLSYLASYYFYINLDLITNLFLKGIEIPQPNIFQLYLFIFLISILLIFKKYRLFFKKLILVNFCLISFFIWFMQINNIKIDDQFHIYRYVGLENINLINVFILLVIEIIYFIWSFLSYKSNLSDWMVNLPQKGDMNPILNILFFYVFLIFYYSVLT